MDRPKAVLLLTTLVLAGCIAERPGPPEEGIAQDTQVRPPLSLAACARQNAYFEVEQNTLAAFVPDGLWLDALGPATSGLVLDLFDCEQVWHGNQSLGAARLAIVRIQAGGDWALYGSNHDLDVVVEVAVDADNPGLLALLLEEHTPAHAAAITVDPTTSTVQGPLTDYRMEIGPSTLSSTSVDVADTRLLFSLRPTMAWADAEVPGAERVSATNHAAVLTANRGALKVILGAAPVPTDAGVSNEKSSTILRFGTAITNYTGPARTQGNATLLLDHCQGRNHFYHVPADQVQPLLPDGFVPGDYQHLFLAATPVVPTAARLQLFGMRCDAYASGVEIRDAMLGWTSVLLSSANGDEASGGYALNSFGFEWFTTPELVPVLAKLGINATVAKVVANAGGLSISTPGHVLYASACVPDPSGGLSAGLDVDKERRFYADAEGAIRSFDLDEFRNHGPGDPARLLAADGALAEALGMGTGQCEEMRSVEFYL